MRRISWLFALVACGPAAESPAGPAPAPEAAVAVVPDPPAAAGSVAGRLRAHDGSPLRVGEFALIRNGFMKPAARGPLGEDGSFRVELESGMYILAVSAVDHAQLVQALQVTGPVEVTGNLGTYARPEPGESLQVHLQWQDAAGAQLGAESRTAPRGPAGAYRLDLSGRPPRAARLRYQLDSGTGRTYNGPLADRHESDGGGDFWSVVDLVGQSALELDLARLPPADRPAQLEWRGEPSGMRALRLFRDAWQPRVSALQQSMTHQDGKLLVPDATWRATMAALAAEALAEADAAADDDTRLLLRLAHLDLFTGHDDHADARARADWLLARVDPLDRRLSAFWNLTNLLSRVLDTADETFAARAEAWLARAAAQEDAGTALDALSLLLYRARDRGLDDRVAELYASTREPRFAGTFTAKYLAEQFDPDRALQRGKPLPDFRFPALDVGAPAVSQADRRGKLYFIEFWATWCGPCVADMPDIHAAYAAINGAAPGPGPDGLHKLGAVAQPRIEFVFVSFDQGPGVVQDFRAQHWSMPWTHAFVGLAGEREVMARFGFSGVPTGVLVDEAGSILELGADLRGERLRPTLERALARAPRPI